MLCPNCETENRDTAKFCDECGFPLREGAARADFTARQESAAAEGEDVSAEGDGQDACFAEGEEEAAKQGLEAGAEDVPEHDDAVECADADVEVAAEGALPEEALPEEALPEEETAAIDDRETPYAQPSITATIGDLGGLDQQAEDYGERVVGPGYEQPQAVWRDGHTMQMPSVDSGESAMGKDYLASSTTEQRKTARPLVIAIVAVALVAAIVAFATYQMQLWGGKAVPDVTGMTAADAASVLEDGGFGVRTMQVKSDDTEGLVLIMDPTAGSRVDEGAEVVIHVAAARSVPDIVGKTQEEAEAALVEEGYENVTFEGERSNSAEGTVLSVSPEAGTRAKSTIALVVKVAEPFVVPETASLNVDAAASALRDAGLRYDISYVDTESHPEGTVISSEPAAGTKVKGDSVVVLSVARARGAQLTQLTRNMLSPGSTVAIDGVSYDIESLDSVEYLGNDTVEFTITGSPFTYFMGQYVSLDSRQVTGQIVWTPDNGVADIY